MKTPELVGKVILSKLVLRGNETAKAGARSGFCEYNSVKRWKVGVTPERSRGKARLTKLQKSL